MKLEAILEKLNSIEKNSFLKVVENITNNDPRQKKEIEKILSDTNTDLKKSDNRNIARIFNMIEEEYNGYLKDEFTNISSQLDILIDILVRDGNSIMSREWFDTLYTRELKKIKAKVKAFETILKQGSKDISLDRIRDYKIYKECLSTAYYNDELNNQECKITDDELSILITLAKVLGLSQEEIKLINYSITPLDKLDIDAIITELRNRGFIFFSRKFHNVYISDEQVRIFRKFRGKDVADKFLRRVLRLLKNPQINMICRRHNVDIKLPRAHKIKSVIDEGISFSGMLQNDIFKDATNLTERKKDINELINKGLEISPQLRGVTLEEKIDNLIIYFEDIEKEEKISITIDGYEKLLAELHEEMPKLNNLVKTEFELQDEFVLKGDYLIDYNIKPRDVLELISRDELLKFCQTKGIKSRGNLVVNIMESFKDSENLYFENYENIGFRDLNTLKENGIRIKESDIGVKFEDITKSIFTKLGFNVDEKLRRKLNDKKNKIDILLNLESEGIIIIECKTVKESGYNKFSNISRQVKAYIDVATSKDYNVIKSLIVGPQFSDEFVNACDDDIKLNLSLITASTLYNILKGFEKSKHKVFPVNLLKRDVLISEDRILRALNK